MSRNVTHSVFAYTAYSRMLDTHSRNSNDLVRLIAGGREGVQEGGGKTLNSVCNHYSMIFMAVSFCWIVSHKTIILRSIVVSASAGWRVFGERNLIAELQSRRYFGDRRVINHY